jgi:copper(I)-binding protein
MTRHRIEIGLALALTLAAFLFVAMAVWAEQGNGIALSQAWARPTIGYGRITAAYVTDADKLRGASSPKAKRVEIHETAMTDQGVMKMRPVEDGLALPAGETVTLKPGGKHIMVMGLDGELAKGATLPLTLDFEVAGEVEVAVPVGMGPSAAGDDAGASGGADHSHH